MTPVKTDKQRRSSREASRRRRRKQNIRLACFLAVLAVILVVLAVLVMGNPTAPSGPSTNPSGVSTDPNGASTDPNGASTDPSGPSTAPGGVSTAPADPVDPVPPLPTTPTDPSEPSSSGLHPVDGHYVQGNHAAWNLLLVNDWNEMPQSYVATIPLGSFNAVWDFDSRALPYLNAMIEAANAAGCDIWGQSLYRPYEMQKKLYWAEVDNWLYSGYGQEEAEVQAATVVKRPGQSEHNSGLAIDFECREYPYLEEGFRDTRAYEWLISHCAEYGFILRFPQGKEDITGVIYEPWHYRYVGVEAATEIMARGLCLEEYLEEKGL